MIVDLRSDTVTRPSPAMLDYMIKANVGDDVFGEDQTVNALESKLSEMFSMEAALFCPSGTMANQIAIKCHTQPGDEVICEKQSHVYIYEAGGIAFNSGCQVHPLEGVRGLLNAGQVAAAIQPEDIHKPVSSLVVLENTANRGGGSCYELSDLQEIKEVCLNNNLKLHLDAARLWNALLAKDQKASDYGKIFHSISVCLSKGLGAPIGSVLLGSASFIKKARRVRKVLGGGMRQAGYLAAAGIYALENNMERLAMDHMHAKYIAHQLLKKDFIGKMYPVETNILIFEVKAVFTAASFTDYMRMHDILCFAISPSQVRMVMHLDVLPEMIEKLSRVIEEM